MALIGSALRNIRRRRHVENELYLILNRSQMELMCKISEPSRKVNKLMNTMKGMTKVEKSLRKAKENGEFCIPSKVHLQVLGTGASGAPAALYLFTDQSRYLFNCGEGTQRLASEHKAKLMRTNQVFITSNSWSRIGGFPGLSLTLQDAKVTDLGLSGPPHLKHLLENMKSFVNLKTLQITMVDCTKTSTFDDGAITIKYVPLYREYKTLDENAINSSTAGDIVIAYVGKLKPRKGALNLEKCVERGVPPGPLLGKLKNGMEITLENGTVVKPSDVIEPTEESVAFVVVDIPSEEFLPSLHENRQQFYKEEEDDDDVSRQDPKIAVVVHFTPEKVLGSKGYTQFTQSFPPETEHIYLNSHNTCFSGFASSHRVQYQLNQINKRIFPLLGEARQMNDGSNNNVMNNKLSLSATQESSHQKTENLQSQMVYNLRPHGGLDFTKEVKLNSSEYLDEINTIKGFSEQLTQLKNETAFSNIANAGKSLPRITFLGTASCMPNKARNVSGILVQPAENSFILFDCGEGTLGQIVRFFGKDMAESVIKRLGAIFISHLHADHHMGLIDVMNERKRLLGTNHCQKLLLFAPIQIDAWLKFYHAKIEQIQSVYRLIGNAQMLQQPLELATEYAELGLQSIATCLVPHCAHSFGVCLTTMLERDDKPIKITYSGDTIPCRSLVALGADSTILIHEASLEDELLAEAKAKMHCTISQAIEQGRKMRAKYIILTHFSQRYAKLPRLPAMENENRTDAENLKNVAVAFDNMHVSMEDLELYHLLYPALKTLFADYTDELELRALKREYKMERKRKRLYDD